MEELTNAFAETVEVSNNGASSHKEPRIRQWKTSSKFGDQKIRRENRLKELKEKRDQAKATARKLSNEETGNRPEGKVMMEFKGALMQSEWLIDTPENFEDWVVKVCPIGRRRLLHASYGETCLYNGRGQRTHKTYSGLPGGFYGSSHCETLLDGIMCSDTWTFYVLDILTWDNYHVRDCDFEFRHFWLNQKLEDFAQKKGGLRIVPAPSFEMTKINTFLEQRLVEIFPNESIVPLVDGFMFYHKGADYTNGTTPLVGWLKPEHLQDQFPNAKISLEYLKKPFMDLRRQFDAPDALTTVMN
ncbi:Oidioi.mRNA.OKI2018_I69.PAR.g10676.t1.cds [Oikopleura dioica]|uniref:Snurportin-1 n=1 Tax=Oikopleura dioica TaxID=34765 RepID=A0ABN7RVA0_OIKDI|nr:Oidioi.mRNA.OKI2018_I69.PAR.g10676.t1.cds [Oikopleura dioica]